MNIRIAPEIKADVERIYARYGMTITQAINIFLHESCSVGGLPFDLRPSTPNAETRAAIDNVNHARDMSPAFDNIEDLVASLNA